MNWIQTRRTCNITGAYRPLSCGDRSASLLHLIRASFYHRRTVFPGSRDHTHCLPRHVVSDAISIQDTFENWTVSSELSYWVLTAPSCTAIARLKVCVVSLLLCVLVISPLYATETFSLLQYVKKDQTVGLCMCTLLDLPVFDGKVKKQMKNATVYIIILTESAATEYTHATFIYLYHVSTCDIWVHDQACLLQQYFNTYVVTTAWLCRVQVNGRNALIDYLHYTFRRCCNNHSCKLNQAVTRLVSLCGYCKNSWVAVLLQPWQSQQKYNFAVNRTFYVDRAIRFSTLTVCIYLFVNDVW